MSNQELGQTAKSASLISFSAFMGAIAGFVLQLLVAYFFGASHTTDAFFMAQSTSELLTKVLLGGSLTAVFLPLFVDHLTHGKKESAWHLGMNLVHLMAFIFIVFIVLLGIFAEPFVRFIAPGFDAPTTALTVSLLRLLLPSFLFLFLVDMATAMLHAVKHFLTPALLRIVAPLTSAFFVGLFAPAIGIYSLAIGVIVGSIIQLSLLVLALKKEGFTYHFVFSPRDPDIRHILYLVYPFIFSVLVTQGAGIVYRILVSDLTAGSLSALKFAEKITQLCAIMFLNSVTYVIYPTLSAKASTRNYLGMRETISGAIRLVAFVTIPIIAGVIILRDPLISFIYQRGSFSATDAAMTSAALLYLIIGLTTNGISSILGHATLALKQTRASVAVTISTQAISIGLFVVLVPLMGHAGLALASSLVPLAIALLYYLYLTRFIPRLYLIFWHPTLLKTLITTLFLTLVVYLANKSLVNFNLTIPGTNALRILVPTLTGITTYVLGAYILQIKEMTAVINLLKTKWIGWRRGGPPSSPSSPASGEAMRSDGGAAATGPDALL